MTNFQFDKCFNDKKIIERCNAGEQVTALRLPRKLFDAEDPELLAALLPLGNPIVTIDRALPSEHASHIPDANPGIVVVCYSRNVVNRTLTTHAAASILERFKQQVTIWNTVSIRNSIITITEADVEVCHVQNGRLERDSHLVYYSQPNWVTILLASLQTNTDRFALT